MGTPSANVWRESIWLMTVPGSAGFPCPAVCGVTLRSILNLSIPIVRSISSLHLRPFLRIVKTANTLTVKITLTPVYTQPFPRSERSGWVTAPPIAAKTLRPRLLRATIEALLRGIYSVTIVDTNPKIRPVPKPKKKVDVVCGHYVSVACQHRIRRQELTGITQNRPYSIVHPNQRIAIGTIARDTHIFSLIRSSGT